VRIGALPGGGEHALDVDSLDDIVQLATDSLAAAGGPRRFHALATDGDCHASLALFPECARRLARVLRLEPLPRVDRAIGEQDRRSPAFGRVWRSR
jgi:hypothetical protein